MSYIYIYIYDIVCRFLADWFIWRALTATIGYGNVTVSFYTRISFSQLFPICLSRACLGKMIGFSLQRTARPSSRFPPPPTPADAFSCFILGVFGSVCRYYSSVHTVSTMRSSYIIYIIRCILILPVALDPFGAGIQGHFRSNVTD
jgi:hypothetical protein